MSVVTAQIVAGTADLYRGGVQPLHVLWFSEGGSRPSWMLERAGLLTYMEDEHPPGRPVVLVPETPETMLEDGMLLLACRGMEDEIVVAEAEETTPELLNSDFLDLTKHPHEELASLRGQLRYSETPCQLTVILFHGCSLYEQLPTLEMYPFNLEVCTTTYSRQRTPWSPHGRGFGSLATRPAG